MTKKHNQPDFANGQSNTILYAEDDENYARLLECTLKQAGYNHTLRVVKDGSEAMMYLKGEEKYADRAQFPLPNVVLADLKMPRVTGFEVLEWIRKRPELRSLIVVVLTSSASHEDISKAYELGANAYLVKPTDTTQLLDILQAIKHFWLTHNHAPQPTTHLP